MLKSQRFFQRIVLLSVAVLVVMIVWVNLTSDIALSQQIDSRVNNLEADLNRLESRFNRLENQLDQLRGVKTPRRSDAAPSPNNRSPNRTQLSREQMFDRLATLVIELKQQVNKLETRVSQLEKA